MLFQDINIMINLAGSVVDISLVVLKSKRL